MNDAERKYSTCEREALAVIFALRKFRVYLLSFEQFCLITDHQALQYAFQRKDVHGRLARSFDFMAEHIYKIVYRPGTKNGAAEFLSRHAFPSAGIDSNEDEGDLACSVVTVTPTLDQLEPHLQDLGRFLAGEEMLEADTQQKRRIKMMAKSFMLWNGQLFRRTGSRLRVVPAASERSSILASFHEEIGHWDATTTKQFVTERYWWPLVYRDVYEYVKTCEGCLKGTPLMKYRSTLRIPLTILFDVFSVDFAGPFRVSKNRKRVILVGVEYLTRWPLARATRFSTEETVVKFVDEEVLRPFGPPRVIISDNANCFTASALVNFVKEHGIAWRTVLAYAPMSNGRAERMVGTLKRAVTKMVLNGQGDWEAALPKVVYGYRRRRLWSGHSSFELFYGVTPRMETREPAALFGPSSETHRSMELLATSVVRARSVEVSRKLADEAMRQKVKRFSIGDEVLVAKGVALNAAMKWPAFTSKSYGPCRVVGENHPRYTLLSPHNRISRKAIHVRRLVAFRRRPAHLFA